MIPQVDASGESIKLGGISKRGCVALRAILVQAAWAAVKSGGKERNPQHVCPGLAAEAAPAGDRIGVGEVSGLRVME